MIIRRNHTGIKWKIGNIILLFSIGGILFFFLMIITTYSLARSYVNEDAEKLLHSSAMRMAAEIEKENTETINIARTMALAHENGLFGNRTAALAFAREVLKRNPQLTGLSTGYEANADQNDLEYLQSHPEESQAMNPKGRFISYWNVSPYGILLEPLAYMDSFLYYEETREIFHSDSIEKYNITEPYFYRGKFMVEFVYPISIDGRFSGLIGLDRYLNDLLRPLEKYKPYKSLGVILISKQGRLLSSNIDLNHQETSTPSGNREITEKSLPPAPEEGELNPSIKEMAYSDILSLYYEHEKKDLPIRKHRSPRDGKLYYYAGALIDTGNWTLVIRVAEEEVIAPAKMLFRRLNLLMLLFAMIVLPLSRLLANILKAPIKELISVSAQIAEGNFQVSISSSPVREINYLKESMKKTAKELEELTDSMTLEKKEAETSREQFLNLVNNIPGVSFRCAVNESYTMEFISDKIKELSGYDKNDFLGNRVRTFSSIILPEDLKNIRPVINEGLRSGRPYTIEYRIRRADGQIRWVHEQSRIFRDGIKNPYADGVLLDITERIEQETELKRLKGFLTSIIDSMPSILIGIDRNGRITQWNKKAEQSFGESSEEVQGRPLTDVLPRFKAEMKDILKSIYAGQVYQKQKVYRQEKKNSLHEDITIYPLIPVEDQGAVIRIDDVSNECRLEERLHQKSKMDAIGQLAGGVAHDFNNMLSGIMGAAELLKYAPDEKRRKQYIDIVLQSAGRASELTSKLLTFSRVGVSNYSVINVHEIISDVISLLERSVDKKISILSRFEAADSIIKGNASELQNALLNIGINASHAMDTGEILYSSENRTLDSSFCDESSFDISPGEFLELKIADTGEGIPEDILWKIFDPFFTTKGEGHGTGLGLSLVYGAIQKHRGAIQVESVPGEGTVFTLLLPLTKELSTSAGTKSPKARKGSGTILLADDEELIRTVASAMLENLGYQVLIASTGREALELYRKKMSEIDLVILDMIMPEMNGREAFEEMMKINPDCRIVISSGFSNDPTLNELPELAGYIAKPFQMQELSELLAHILNESEQ